MYGIIYLIQNAINGKKYIGQTTQGLKRRKAEHIRYARKGYDSHLYKAIRFYGEEKFIFTEIGYADDQDSLNEKEKYYIKLYKTDKKRLGYNKTLGGEGGIPTQETREKLSDARKGKKNHMWGKPSNQRRRIICEQNLVIYDSIDACAKNLNLKPSNISMVLNKHINSIMGYSFKYHQDGINYEKKEIYKNYLKIICEQTGKVFKSMRECSIEMNISSSTISRCLRNSNRSHKGLTFRYYEEGHPVEPKPIIVKIKQKRVKKKKDKKILGKSIICLQTLKIYPTVKSASIDLKISSSAISNNLCKRFNHIRGYVFEYYIEGKNYLHADFHETGAAMKIICEQTGKIYNSLSECAKSMELSNSQISQNLNGQVSHVKGFTFSKRINEVNYEGKEKVINMRKKIKIRCIQNNRNYESLSDCARDLHISHTKISLILKGKRKSVKGFTFELI
jgi:group I intron endonuclease